MVTRSLVLMLFGALVLLSAGTQAQSGDVRVGGRIVDRTGAALPGVTVTLTGGTTRQAISDDDGRYVFTDLTSGSYTLTATLPGFQTLARTVFAGQPGSFALDFTLQLGCDGVIDWLEIGLPMALSAADAVLYVRVKDAGHPAGVFAPNCVDGYEHAATVLAVIKSPRLNSDTIRLLRRRSTGYRVGDELIVFLERHSSGAFLESGRYVFPVTGGRVEWRRDDLPGVTDGSSVRDVLEGLRNTLSMIR
jgi:hypothetical protein